MVGVTEKGMDYYDKLILAPMVRIGSLPMRLAALDYGADIVYTPETIDKKIIGSERRIDEATGCIEYVKGDQVCFRTHAAERGRVVFQMGTADAELALQAALTVKQDVIAVDVNCGCPKRFSIQGGMGAALLSDPERLRSILVNLVQNSGLPVSCKIRVLETREQTLDLVRMIATTGVVALAVHCRTKHMRSETAALYDYMKDIVEAVHPLPVIVNGDVFQYADVQRIQSLTNAHSFMIARGAQKNPSCFRKEGMLSNAEVIKDYLRKSVDVNNPPQNTKYTLMEMYTDNKITKSPEYRQLVQSKTLKEFCAIWGIEDYYIQKRQEQNDLLVSKGLPPLEQEDPKASKKRKKNGTFVANQPKTEVNDDHRGDDDMLLERSVKRPKLDGESTQPHKEIKAERVCA